MEWLLNWNALWCFRNQLPSKDVSPARPAKGVANESPPIWYITIAGQYIPANAMNLQLHSLQPVLHRTVHCTAKTPQSLLPGITLTIPASVHSAVSWLVLISNLSTTFNNTARDYFQSSTAKCCIQTYRHYTECSLCTRSPLSVRSWMTYNIQEPA